MRQSHVADEGTYAGFALLRALCARPGGDRLALNWYHVDEAPQDLPRGGRAHLERPGEWEGLDPEALALLGAAWTGDGGSLSALRDARIVPASSIWFIDPVPEDRASRAVWHRRALRATADAGVVFLAPDDGLELPVLSIAARRDRRTVVLDGELRDYLARGQAVVCRQRRPPTTWPQVMAALRPRLAGMPGSPVPVAVKVGDHGFLLLAPTAEARERLLAGARAMLAAAAQAGWTRLPISVHEDTGLTLAQALPGNHHAGPPGGAVEAAIAADARLDQDDRALLLHLYRRLAADSEPPGA